MARTAEIHEITFTFFMLLKDQKWHPICSLQEIQEAGTTQMQHSRDQDQVQLIHKVQVQKKKQIARITHGNQDQAKNSKLESRTQDNHYMTHSCLTRQVITGHE